MKKKILITSTDVMMYLFLIPHVHFLSNNNYQVDIACSTPKGFIKEGYEDLLKNIKPSSTNYFHLSAERSPFDIKKNLVCLKELNNIIEQGNYDLIWTNEPVMGFLTRLAASMKRKTKTKVLYLVHGYHFFKGANIFNWIFYPIEKIMTRLTDLTVTINKEDYTLTKNKFHHDVKHIYGIGFDLNKYKAVAINAKSKKKEMGYVDSDVIILSVGELMRHKNHEIILRAISKISNPSLKYIICGMGNRLNYLKNLTNKLNISDKVSFLGYRNDVDEILAISDIFVHPSKREGLGIAALEAMCSGLPIITSNVHGLKDYSISGKTGFCFEPNDLNGFKKSIEYLLMNPKIRKEIGNNNIDAVKKFNIDNSTKSMGEIISELLCIN